MRDMGSGEAGWALVVPVKRLELAKTRLGPPYDALRRDLALAFALDTVAAALGSTQVRGVVAVTDDPQAAAQLRDIGAYVVADEPAAGLNPALSHGSRIAAGRHPGSGTGALSADLPALRRGALARALQLAAEDAPAAFVRDVHGTGTTLVLAAAGRPLQPLFGPGSARRHVDAGHVDIVAEHDVAGGLDSLRLDVDTAADLDLAIGLGVGPRTAAVLRRLDVEG